VRRAGEESPAGEMELFAVGRVFALVSRWFGFVTRFVGVCFPRVISMFTSRFVPLKVLYHADPRGPWRALQARRKEARCSDASP